MTGNSQGTVLFITGAFIGNNCWDEWKLYFESKGYTCIAPAWPYKEASPEELRNKPAIDAITSNTVASLTTYFVSIISDLNEKPILIGHSLGGLIVQVLMQREMGVVGVAMHSFPPQGINKFRLSFVKAIWEAMVLFSSGKTTYLMSFNKWRYAVANGLDFEQQKELYYLYATPESKKIIREAFSCVAKIDFGKPHPPLLITSGSKDKLIPASVNYNNYKKYANDNSVTEYMEFKTHTHLVFGVPQWKEEADAVLHWLQGFGKSNHHQET